VEQNGCFALAQSILPAFCSDVCRKSTSELGLASLSGLPFPPSNDVFYAPKRAFHAFFVGVLGAFAFICPMFNSTLCTEARVFGERLRAA
jgi:hypothetical protein